MNTAAAWQAYADDSTGHRDPTDPDVQTTINQIRHEAELDHLQRAGRDLSSMWETAP